MRNLVVFGLALVVLLLGRVVQADTGLIAPNATSDPVHVTRCEPLFTPNFSNYANDYPIGSLPGYDVATDVYPPGDLSTVSTNSVLSQYPYGPSHSPNRDNGRPYLAITYTNNATNRVRSVNFGLVVGDKLLDEALDKESALPGAQVERALTLKAHLPPITSNIECVPLKVTYDDGTHWTNPRTRGLKKSIHEI